MPMRMEGVRKIGKPLEMVRDYEKQGIDEICYLDCVSSLYGRNSLASLVADTADFLMTPLCVGGGVKSVEDVRALLNAGADKIALNTAALKNPDLITDLANKIGSQSVVIHIDAKRKGDTWEAYCEGGRQPSGRNAISWAKEVQERGAGEILLTSIDNQGRSCGLDSDLISQICTALTIPIIASGGIGNCAHVLEAARLGVSGVAMAKSLHQKQLLLDEIREYLHTNGVHVRRSPQDMPCA